MNDAQTWTTISGSRAESQAQVGGLVADGPVTLQPMTSEQFVRWRERAVDGYAREKVASGAWERAGATARARREFETLLPNGVATADHHLFSAYENGDPVGMLWLFVSADRGEVFINEIAVHEDRRGRGLGRALLEAGETWSRKRGMRSVSLHVFGHNHIARRLYESSGYHVTDLSMRKSLT